MQKFIARKLKSVHAKGVRTEEGAKEDTSESDKYHRSSSSQEQDAENEEDSSDEAVDESASIASAKDA